MNVLRIILSGVLLLSVSTLFSQESFLRFTDPVRLDGAVNTPADESMPVFSKDSSKLYFVRTFDERNKGGEYDQDIWMSIKDPETGVYAESESVDDLNNKFHNGIFGINKDESTIYLVNAYEGKREMEKGVAITEHKGRNGYAKPDKLLIDNFMIEGDFYGFHVNEGETVLLVSHKGIGTIGEEDLYVSFPKEDGSWTEPKHLGSTINTTGFEISPFLSPGTDTLYFASNGHPGMGDADLFFSVRKDDSWQNWSAPVNLGDKINSEKFDAFLVRSDNMVYFASNRDGEYNDIYRAEVLPPPPPPIVASIETTDVTEHGGSDGTVNLTVEGGVGPYTYAWSNGAGEEDLENVVADTYEVTITDSKGTTMTVQGVVNEPPTPVVTDPVPVSTVAGIIYFDLNSSYLNSENLKDLNAIIPKLKQTDQKIEVISHCDKRASDVYNMWLSERRMNRTIEYLLSNGISKSRISGNYKGERDPDIECAEEDCSEEEHTKNRRTTIRLIN